MCTGIFEGSSCSPCFEGSVLRDLSWFQQIKKDLKKYSKIFEQKDRLSQSKASKVSLKGCSRAHPCLGLSSMRGVCRDPGLACAPTCEGAASNGEQRVSTGSWNQQPLTWGERLAFP